MPVRRLPTRPEGDRVPHSSKVRRIKTVADVYYNGVDRLSRDLEVLQHEVFDEVISRLQTARIPLSDNMHTLLDFMWPQDHAQVWQKLLYKPMTVTTEELLAIFDLELSTESTLMPTPGDQIYYVRSIPLTVESLRRIIGKWQAEKRHADECTAWLRAIRFIEDWTEIIYVRYIGTSNTCSAWSRHTTDGTRRHGGLYGHFREAMEEICPDSITSCTTHEFSKAAAKALRYLDGKYFPLDYDHSDIREQALIALFGQSVLLNRQAGGVSVSYQPEERDINHFEKLNTHLFDKFLRAEEYGYAKPDVNTIQRVAKWMHEVCKLGEDHPKELGTDKQPVTPQLRQAWTEQAVPCTFHGRVLALIIGDFCPKWAMINPATYWKQENRSVRYLKTTFARLAAQEDGKESNDTDNFNTITEKHILPWINFQYTLKRKDYREDSAELMRRYLAAIEPLVVMSFERQTSGALRTDFVGIWSKHDFHPDVGVPEIHYYTHRGNVGRANSNVKVAEFPVKDEECYIQLPSIHPGADKYENGVPEQRRVFEMTMWQFDLLLECALDLLCSRSFDSRAELCSAILDSFRRRWTLSGNSIEFEIAKQALAEWYKKKPGRYSKDAERQYQTNLDGAKVYVNQNGGLSLYWIKPSGKEIKIVVECGRGSEIVPSTPSDDDEDQAVRTVHFLPKGIDVRDAAGKSMSYKRQRDTFANPSFPLLVMQEYFAEKEWFPDLVELWEHETELNFKDACKNIKAAKIENFFGKKK